MTVSNLWAVLDESGCGRPVKINDFNFTRGQQTILAVDLSIWICEGIASTALSTFHSDPVLNLVYTRTIKLLRLGLGLVFVTEGHRRSLRPKGGGDKVTVRRSESQFLDACRRCEIILKALGVPVVRADAEAEALCALLDSSGLVDGVISNDGDCFLFGARTIYTNFTLENLEEGKVMRYDSERLTAIVNSPDSDSEMRRISLIREDLIAFSMICGSDMCGAGILHCGHRKAVRFLDACRRTTRKCDGTCLDKMLSWSDESAIITLASRKDLCNIDCDDDGPCTVPLSRKCSICLHAGDKVSHQTHGCAECGTEPGECCIAVTSDEKFLRSLKEKALSRSSTLAPRHIVDQYFSPNGNTVPIMLRSLRSKPYNVSPDSVTMFTTSIIFKGKTKESSHEYIKQTLPKLLARLDLWSSEPRNRHALTSKTKCKPVPIRIDKCVVRNLVPCYEVTWSITICVVDKDDTFEFNTCEFQSLLDSAYPQLVETFHQQERRRQQTRFQDERRKRFGVGNVARKNNNAKRNECQKASNHPQGGGKKKRKYDRNFDMIKIHKTSTGRGLRLGLDVSLLIDNMPEEFSDGDVTIPLDDFTGKDYEEILDDDFLHEILFSDNQNNIEEIAVGSCDNEYHFLPMHEVLVENECDRRCDYCPIGARDDINSHDHLSSNDLNQCDLRNEVLYCDFGTIQVTVSPIIPRRSRINPIII